MKKIFLVLLFLSAVMHATVGRVVQSYPLPVDQPYGLAIDGKNLLISDRATGKLFVFSIPAGKITGSFPLPCDHPLGIVRDDKGLWVSDPENRRIFHFLDRERRVDTVLTDVETDPAGLGWDGVNLWATAGKKYLKLDPADGTEVQTFDGPGSDTTAVFHDGKYLWLSERTMDRIVCATPDGDIFGVLPSPGPYPTGICRLEDRLWVLDFEQRRLYVLDISFTPAPYYLGDPHRRNVRFSHSLYNRGPSADVRGSLYLCVGEDDAHQKIVKPLTFNRPGITFVSDDWGQKFARLEGKIPALQTLELGYTAQVETRNLKYFILPEWVQTLDKIPAEIGRKYLVDGHKLNRDDPYIRGLVKSIVVDEKNPFWIAFRIHRWLHTNIEYRMNGGWNAAPTVLKRGNGSCSEFTFCFLALARAAGLPARYEAGLVVRGDDASIDRDFHRWVQVWLPPFGWIPVDPSNGKPTTAMAVAQNFGSLSERFFITTHSGGDSPFLGWTYNYHSTYEFSGNAVVESRSEAKWDPVKKE